MLSVTAIKSKNTPGLKNKYLILYDQESHEKFKSVDGLSKLSE